jgi:hypothetical protein
MIEEQHLTAFNLHFPGFLERWQAVADSLAF